MGNGGGKWVIDSVLVGCLCFGGASFMLRACTFDALLVHVGRVLVGGWKEFVRGVCQLSLVVLTRNTPRSISAEPIMARVVICSLRRRAEAITVVQGLR